MLTKVCVRCKVGFPATTEHFTPRDRPGHRGKHGVDSCCRTCINDQARERYARNRDKVRERAAAYRAANADLVREQKRQSWQRNKAHTQQYYADHYPENRERALERVKAWVAANLEQAAANKRRYYLRNGEKVRARAREWAKANPERLKANNHARKCRIRGAAGRFTGEDMRRQYAAQQGLCFYCQEKLEGFGTVDHYVPLCKGGANDPSNIVLACATCNRRKHYTMPEIFIQRLRLGN